jgi:hypothetical protein
MEDQTHGGTMLLFVRLKRNVLFVVIFAAIAWPAQAEFFTGNALWDLCRYNRTAASYVAMGMTDGMINMYGPGVSKPMFCVRNGVTTEQVTDLVCKELELYPQLRDRPAFERAYAAILGAFHCW